MCEIRMIRPAYRLVIIPVDEAIYCRACRSVTNSHIERCGKCGGDSVLRLATLIDQPPSGPESGPGSSGCIVSGFHMDLARAA
jgi:hypothetical protein